MHDVLIIGGGPAGLSAALVLGRCRRDVLLIDDDHGRNRRARELHGFLTRDGVSPADLRAAGRAEAQRYGVQVVAGTVTHAERVAGGFRITYRHERTDAAQSSPGSDSGTEGNAAGRTLLLATGMRDLLPPLPGIDEFYGTTVHHCPYCDGWEHRDARLVAYGAGDRGVGLALSLRTWSGQVIACTAGDEVSAGMRTRAQRRGITIREERIVRLEGAAGRLERVVFAEGAALACDALFFNTDQLQRSDLPRRLGCSFRDNGGVATDERQCTGISGLYLAGDADKDVQFAIVAAAEGAAAAVAINHELQRLDEQA